MQIANKIFSMEKKMTEDLMKESMNALKEFAKHKNSYENMPNNLNINGISNDGNLFYGIQDIKLFKSDVIFSIRWTNKMAKLYFLNALTAVGSSDVHFYPHSKL